MGFRLMYADDCQIYVSFKPQFIKQTQNRVKACLSDIQKWMNSSFLKLNPDKTNLIILSSKSNPQHSLPFKLTFNKCTVPPLDSVISLGVNIGRVHIH